MADPNIPIHADDVRFEDRSGCFVLVDPTAPHGGRDVAVAWEEAPDRWRWKPTYADSACGTPYPAAPSRDDALEAMLADHARHGTVAARLEAHRPRFSFGQPQIVRV